LTPEKKPKHSMGETVKDGVLSKSQNAKGEKIRTHERKVQRN